MIGTLRVKDIPVRFRSFKATTARSFIKHKPTIMTVTGSIGVIASTIFACKATMKLDSELEPVRGDLEAIHESARLDKGYAESKEYRKELTKIWLNGAVIVGRLYAPSTVIMGGSLFMINKSHMIMVDRNARLTSELATAIQAAQIMKNRFIERYGEEAYNDLAFDTSVEKQVVEYTDENGKKHKKKKEIKEYNDPSGQSMFTRCFDISNGCFFRDDRGNYQNERYLREMERSANYRLQKDGYLFFDDLLTELGFTEPNPRDGNDKYLYLGRSFETRKYGWLWDPTNSIDPTRPYDRDNTNVVKFGIIKNDLCKNDYVMLHFNVEGIIEDKFKDYVRY